MSFPTRRKVLYPTVVALLLVVTFVVFRWSGSSPVVLMAMAALFLIPGRIAGYFYRGLFTARRRRDAGDHAGALHAIDGFLADIAAHPRRKRWHWLVWLFYTNDIEAMAENNAGAILLEIGDLDGAESRFTRSLSIDPEYSIPHRNLAAIWELRGNDEMAAESRDMAYRLGYRNTGVDRLIDRAAGAFAVVEGQSHTDRS